MRSTFLRSLVQHDEEDRLDSSEVNIQLSATVGNFIFFATSFFAIALLNTISYISRHSIRLY